MSHNTKRTFGRNVLGDIAAERDHDMLKHAFCPTQSYHSLDNAKDCCIAVGRRGTGKSAIHWKMLESQSYSLILDVSPTEPEMIGLRSLVRWFGDRPRIMQAGARIMWHYALLMEVLDRAAQFYRTKSIVEKSFVLSALSEWRKLTGGLATKMRIFFENKLGSPHSDKEAALADLAHSLNSQSLLVVAAEAAQKGDRRIAFLIDRIDEGFEDLDECTAVVAGLTHAVIELNAALHNTRLLVFIRDNLFRALSRTDKDFSKIENHFERIHWQESELFEMVTLRMKKAFDIDADTPLRIWQQCMAPDMKRKDAFRMCLRMTLWRPRELLSLLNRAFEDAGRVGGSQLTEANINSSAIEHSRFRLHDLRQEYSDILPGLEQFTSAFSDSTPTRFFGGARKLVKEQSKHGASERGLELFNGEVEVCKFLYQIGFIGVYDEITRMWQFCHDGSDPNREFEDRSRIMIHPSYWPALGITDTSDVADDDMHDISDGMAESATEDKLQILPGTKNMRKINIEGLITQLGKIPQGSDGASQFEDWCRRAIAICFSPGIKDVVLHPNGAARNQRDVVGLVTDSGDVWSRILKDYNVRHIVFEIKNYEVIKDEDYRQLQDYLNDKLYGRLGFIVTRDKKHDVDKEDELPWIKGIYEDHNKLIMKLTGGWLQKALRKLRSPERDQAGNRALEMLLTLYERKHLAGDRRKKKRKEPRSRA